MTVVVSIRVPSALDRAVRTNAHRSRMMASKIVGLILEYSLCGHYNFSRLRDVQEFLGTKLDIRLEDALVSKLRVQADRLQVSVSVYVRTILYSYYLKRLIFMEKEGDYTLEENNAPKTEAKSA